MSFGSDEDTDITGGGVIERTGRITFDHNSSEVTGWGTIWQIIDGEEKDKEQLMNRLQNGVSAYIEKRDS